MSKLKGSEIIIECLRREGVDTIFGYPGGAILDIYDELSKTPEIKHYLTRHEQGAVHAAEGYARVKNKVGVALVTSGPGATNTITGIANAYLDCYPIVIFTGQVSSDLIGKDAFQEANIISITKDCTKKNYLITKAEDIAKTIKEAFFVANSGKKGPVVIDMAKNIYKEVVDFDYDFEIEQKSIEKYKEDELKRVFELLQKAQKPLIIAGGGVVSAGAEDVLKEFADKLNIPVANTLMGVGAYPASGKKFLGMIGMFGNFWANHAVNHADVIFAIGARFNDRITACVKPSDDAKLIHLDIDFNNISKSFKTDISICADAKKILGKLNKFEIKEVNFDREKWFDELMDLKSKKSVPTINTDKITAVNLLKTIADFTKKYNPTVVTEVGQHQLWAASAFEFEKSRKFLTSGGLGTMGFGFPAGIGAFVADNTSPVIVIAGDGSIQMNIQEIATCVQYRIPLKVIIMNNSRLGMVRQLQEKFFNKNYYQTDLQNPDFVKIAEAYGACGIRVEKEEEIIPAMQKAMDIDGIVFIDVVLEPMEYLYPFVKGE